jgi:Protein of unknown function (DUF4238)
MPVSSHYVPRVILRRFSSSRLHDNPIIWRLDKETGRVSRTSVNNQTVINDYNRISEEWSAHMGVTPQYFEHEVFEVVETAAGKLIDKLCDGAMLTDDERVSLAAFVCLQYTRTPRMRTTTMFWQQAMEPFLTKADLHDLEATREAIRKREGGITEEEVDNLVNRTYKELLDEHILLTAGQDREIWSMFLSIDRFAPKVAREMTWIIQRSTEEAPFVISDHPVAIYDPHVGGARGGGWFGSTGTEVSMPLDQELCLMMVPGEPRQNDGVVGQSTVDEMNLKSYGSAEWAVYAHDERVLTRLQTLVEELPAKVRMYTPQPAEISGLEPEGGVVRAPKPSRRPWRRRS